MDRQPIAITPDETSTEQVVEGGTLTNIIEQEKKTGMLSVFPYTIDSFHGEMYREDGFTIDANVTGRLFYYDPGLTLISDSYNSTFIPYQLLPILTHTFYDFDIEKTFVAIKHERARGKLLITWYPGILIKTPGRTTDFASIDQTVPNFGTLNSKCQRWIWDIEQTDTFTIMIKGFKNSAWRSRNLLTNYQTFPVLPNQQYTIYSEADQYPTYNFGLLCVSVILPYWPGNVAPNTLDILMFNRLVNEKYMEYRQLQGVNQIAIENNGQYTNN